MLSNNATYNVTDPNKNSQMAIKSVPSSTSIDDKNFSYSQSREHILSVSNDMKNEKVNEKEVTTITPARHKVEHPTSYLDTMLHLFRGNIGSGLLAMGDAFKNGGIIFAPIMTVALAIISVHAQHLLLTCSEEMDRLTRRHKPPNFAETVQLVFEHGPIKYRGFASKMSFLVKMFLVITQLGFCCVYIVFIANNIKLICDQYDINLELSALMAVIIIPILLESMVRNLKYLTPFSTIANVLMAVGVSAVVFKAAQDLPPVSTRNYIGNWDQLPLFFGTVIYAFEGIGLILPLKNEMRKPENFQKKLGVLNVGMIVVSGIIIGVGFLGYLKWGEEVKGSLTLNLEPKQLYSNVVQGLITTAILFTYPLQFYVPVDITWPGLQKKLARSTSIYEELIYRALLVMLTFILAETIPNLGLFISLVGAISSTALALMFPPLIDIVMNTNSNRSSFYLFKNIMIIIIGLYIFSTGTFESVRSIVKTFYAKKE